MSFPKFGPPAASAFPTSQLLLPPTSHTSTTCCESGRPIMADPHTGRTICSCQLPPGLLSYSRVPGLPESVYSAAYVPIGADPAAFYAPMSAYDLKDKPEAWRAALSQTAASYYPYDPTMAAYPYTNGYTGLDLNGAHRKNATREATTTLKAWLQEHIKNPYPTKGEKIMLAIITKMTLTQVSTWFANARRRLKKENKMTWSPRNRADGSDDGKDDDDLESDVEVNRHKDDTNRQDHSDDDDDDIDINGIDDTPSLSGPLVADDHSRICERLAPTTEMLTPPGNTETKHSFKDQISTSMASTRVACIVSPSILNSDKQNPKPKIWSLADTATSSKEPKDNFTSKERTPQLDVKHGHHFGSGNPVKHWVNTPYSIPSRFPTAFPHSYVGIHPAIPRQLPASTGHRIHCSTGAKD